jgi:oxygen-dependent protoporphyrinogen oxidase
VVRRHLGDQVTSRLADPLIVSIGPAWMPPMSAAAVFPQLLAADDRAGSLMRALRAGTPSGNGPVFLRIRGGMHVLVHRLAAELDARGVELRTETPVERLEPDSTGGTDEPTSHGWRLACPGGDIRADAVVLTSPAVASARLVREVLPELADHLAGIEYASVTLATMTFPAQGLTRPLDASGYLIPAQQGLVTTACTWLSAKWPDLMRPGEILLRVSAGRFGDDRASRLSDHALASRLLAELRAVLGIDGSPNETMITRWPEAFPQYRVHHLEVVASVERAAELSGPPLALAGAALHGVGIPACVGSGRRAARAVLTRLHVPHASP